MRLAGATELRVLDLGAGTGANVRYLARLLRGDDRRTGSWSTTIRRCWPAAAAAAIARRRTPSRRARWTCQRPLDPAADDICARAAISSPRPRCSTLCRSAGCIALARRCRDAGAAVLFALTYNGGIVARQESRKTRWFAIW